MTKMLLVGCFALAAMVGVSLADGGNSGPDGAATNVSNGRHGGVVSPATDTVCRGKETTANEAVSSLNSQGIPVQAGPCVKQASGTVDCKCGADGHVVKANCEITVNPATGQKCGGPYCESCYVVCNRK